jgi:signal peptidase I
MSFFITGMGEVYSGSTQRGITLLLLRAASALALPFYSMTNVKSSHLMEIFFSLLFFASVTFFSPFNALIMSIKKKKIVVTEFNSARFIAFFAVSNILITLISITVFLSFFSIIRVNQNYPPIIENGDIAVIKKIGSQVYKKGEVAVIKNENLSFRRIIGQPGENVSYSKGRFSNQGSELFQSIFTEEELNRFSLSDFDVISETQDEFIYPVIQNREKYRMDIVLNKDEYFAAPDDRNDIAEFAAVKSDKIYGRLEGILFSVKRKAILIKPFRLSE